MRAFVADASVAVAWVHPAQGSATTAAMLDAMADGARLEVPALWTLEVANALTVLARRRKLTEEERQAALGWLRGLPLAIDHEGSALAFTRLAEIAVAHRLSVYDATTSSWRSAGSFPSRASTARCASRLAGPASPCGSKGRESPGGLASTAARSPGSPAPTARPSPG
jgi:predicted nucleic acid-binding protein